MLCISIKRVQFVYIYQLSIDKNKNWPKENVYITWISLYVQRSEMGYLVFAIPCFVVGFIKCRLNDYIKVKTPLLKYHNLCM